MHKDPLTGVRNRYKGLDGRVSRDTGRIEVAAKAVRLRKEC